MKNTKYSAPIATQCLGGVKTCIETAQNAAVCTSCIALRYPGEELAFDSGKMRFVNKQQANAFLKAPKRNDWDFAKLCAWK